MNTAVIDAIEYAFPSRSETNDDLAREFPEWNVEKVLAKTGIASRRVSAGDECASDLAVRAAQKLFDSGACQPAEIDFILFCTQTPDYFLPSTACLIQDRLGIPQTAGALDFTLGCSGFVYGLSLAHGLIHSGQAKTILLLTADTYTKLVEPNDRNVRTIFGDGGAATLIRAEEGERDSAVGPFVFGTDGRGAENLIVRHGGFRQASGPSLRPTLEMNGPEIFNFTLQVVPECVQELLRKANCTVEDIDFFVPHQANSYMLEHLRKKMKLPPEKFFVGMQNCGNTVSASIPIALKDASAAGLLSPGARVMLLGFGVGYSWGGCFVRWKAPGRHHI